MDEKEEDSGQDSVVDVNKDFGIDDDGEFKTSCMPPALETGCPGATSIQNSSSTLLTW